MRLVDKYIVKQVILYVILVLFIMLAIDIFISVIDELRLCTKNNYLIKHALLFVFFNVPARIYFLCPWAALVGSLIGLGVLAHHHELMVFETIKMSRQQIAFIVVKAMIWFACIMVIIGEIIVPPLEKAACAIKVRNLHMTDLDEQYGIWVRSERYFLHVEEILDQKTLKDILQVILDKDLKLQKILFIKKAYKTDDGWKLEDVVGTKFNNHHTEKYQQAVVYVKDFIDISILHTLNEKHVDRLSIVRLWNLMVKLKANFLSVEKYKNAICSKIMHPINIVIMGYLATPFVFGVFRNRGLMWKFFIGMVISFLYYTMNSIFIELSTMSSVYSIFVVIVPSLFFLSLAIVITKYSTKY